jgi:ABC-2 type transport system permease protein
MAERAATSARFRSIHSRPRGSIPRMVSNETRKGLLALRANWRTLIPELAALVVFYVLLQFFIGGGRIVHAILAPTLLGFAFYSLVYVVTLRMVAGTLEEMNAGTLEQIHLSPLPSWALSVGRLAAATVEAVGVTALVSIGLILVLGIHFTYRLDAIAAAALSLLDVVGFGLLLGGLAVRVNSIGAVLHVMQSTVMFLNGAFVPVILFPGWLQLLARLLPTTLGVEVERKILLQGASLASAWSDGSLAWLLVHAALMFTVGAVVYQLSIRRALRLGRLGPR